MSQMSYIFPIKGLTMTLKQLSHELNTRRRELGIGCPALARRAALSLRTVQRALAGDSAANPSFDTLSAIAEAMGMTIGLKETQSADSFRQRQAERKAAQLVAQVQGTSGLEAQAVPPSELKRMKKQTSRELLAGSARKLWAA